MRRAITALALLTLVACEGTDGPVDGPGVRTLRGALPAGESMTIQMPHSAALTPTQATFYGFTRGITLNVNGLVRGVLNVIEDVVERPPTEADGDRFAIWGPWTEPLAPATYRVRVDKTATGFDYRVEGWPKDEDASAAVIVLEGKFSPTDEGGRGSGRWTYDLTAAHELDPIAHDSIGQVEVLYALEDDRTLEVTFTDVQGPHQAETTSALYRYTDAADGAGTFDYISNIDVHAEDDPTLDRRELIQVRSRWLADGTGRADVLATHGDLPAGLKTDLVECWDTAFEQTFVAVQFGINATKDGDEDACPYADRQLPDFFGFEADSFADGELVDALPEAEDFDIEPVPIADEADEPALYYRIGKGLVAGLEQQTSAVLGQIRAITRIPPTACSADGCRWGPWTDWSALRSYRLDVARVAEKTYAYDLAVKRFGDGADGWKSLVQGGFIDATDGEGQGFFVLDLDVLAAFDPGEQNQGQLRVEYARQGGNSALAARYDQVVFEDGRAPVQARYYLASGDDGGYLDLEFPVDVHEDEPGKDALELFVARLRWASNGAGVADVLAKDGDLEGAEFLVVECWDTRAARTHIAAITRIAGRDRLPNLDGPGCVVTDWQGPDIPPMGDER